MLGAVSVATACLLPESPAHGLANLPQGKVKKLNVEHPVGATGIEVLVDVHGQVKSAAIIRTARKLFDGVVYS